MSESCETHNCESNQVPAPVAPMTAEELENYKLHRRFDRMGRLIGDAKMAKLMKSHVMIVGLGGVGSWAAESIARSGVGKITLVDFDEICVTNFNRQLHATAGKVGSLKSDVMAERLQTINPGAKIISIAKSYSVDTYKEILADKPDFVIDAIDHITSKCHLLTYCLDHKIPVICSTGSGGRLDPTQIKIVDLAFTEVDPLARALRGILREKYNYTRDPKTPFGIPAVVSLELPTAPLDLHYDGGKGFRCVCPQGENTFLTCDKRNLIMGNSSFVTGAFGLASASYAIRELLR